MNFTGVIIEESLSKKDILKNLEIISSKTEPITPEHKTPWLNQWTLHTVEVPEIEADDIFNKLSQTFDENHLSSWYADFKNEEFHYIVFPKRVFKIELGKPEQYNEAVQFGLSLGIPDYQLDFSPDIEEWKRSEQS